MVGRLGHPPYFLIVDHVIHQRKQLCNAEFSFMCKGNEGSKDCSGLALHADSAAKR